MKRRIFLHAGAALAAPAAVRAQSAFPSKPIRYIVPVAAGGGNDMFARVVGERWGKALGQNFIVDNQGGGGGVIASVTTARAGPDGHALMQGYVARHGTTPATRRVPYDAIKDFTPIGMIGGTPNVLVVNAALPVKTLAEFIDYVKKNPARVSYGSAGQGLLTHLTMELFKQQIGAFMLHIRTAASRRRSPICSAARTTRCSPASPRRCRTCARAARALALTGKARSDQLKELPTLEESGFTGFDAIQWYGSVGPAGIATDIVRRLNDAQVAVLRDPDLRERLAVEAVAPMPMTPEQFGPYIRANIQRWTALAKAKNIHLDD